MSGYGSIRFARLYPTGSGLFLFASFWIQFVDDFSAKFSGFIQHTELFLVLMVNLTAARFLKILAIPGSPLHPESCVFTNEFYQFKLPSRLYTVPPREATGTSSFQSATTELKKL